MRVAMAVSRAGARRAMVWGDDRGKIDIRIRAPIDAHQQHNEYLPLGGGDRMSLDYMCLAAHVDTVGAAA